VTEAATNLFKHAVGGVLILRELEHGPGRGLELLALDRGPGMPDLGRCLVDGYSTAGSPGNGLGAMARLSSSLDIHTQPGVGSALTARLWAVPPPGRREHPDLEWGVVSDPVAGEEACGDSWGVEVGQGHALVLVVDGLGHGPQAAEASREAVRAFHARAALSPAEILRAAHEALRSTRGAAMAVASVDFDRREVRYCGVGNISGSILSPGEGRSLSMVSHNGIVGHTIRKVQEFTYPWAEGSLLIMYSDGLVSHWRLDRYAGLLTHHPALVAGVLYRDYRRERDDVTVLVARERSANSP
jgi:hypothetical protein